MMEEVQPLKAPSRQPARLKVREIAILTLSTDQKEKQRQHGQQQANQTTGETSQNEVKQEPGKQEQPKQLQYVRQQVEQHIITVPEQQGNKVILQEENDSTVEQQHKQKQPKLQDVGQQVQQEGKKEQHVVIAAELQQDKQKESKKQQQVALHEQQGKMKTYTHIRSHQQKQDQSMSKRENIEKTVEQQPIPPKQQASLHVRQQGRKEQQQQRQEQQVHLNHSSNVEESLLKADSKHEDIKKRDFIKQMMRHAWRSYKTYAWGKNELKPVSKRGNTGEGFGGTNMGVTIIDSLDTLYVMGMTDEFNESKNWVANNLHFNTGDAISVFEGNIRVGGGLLSAYALTGDDIFKVKAKEFTDKLLPAFDTTTGIPLGMISFQTYGVHFQIL
jgi:hypothetical protein